MVVAEFPAEWDDEGELGNHGVYGQESYDQDGDVDDTYEQDQQEEAGDGMDDVASDMQNENENGDHDGTYEEAQEDDPDEFEEVAEEIQEEDVEQAETDQDNHGWDSAHYESSRKRKRNRAGQKWGFWHRKRERWSQHTHKEEDVEQAETDQDNHGWDSAHYESSRKRNRGGQNWGSWHQKRGRWSEHTHKEQTDNQEQQSGVQMFIHGNHGNYHIQMPALPAQPAESAWQGAPKMQALPVQPAESAWQGAPKGQNFRARDSQEVVHHPWNTEVSEPEQREQRIWPAGLASSLRKGGKGKGGKGKTKGKTKDEAGKGKRPFLMPQPLLPDTARGLPRAVLFSPLAGSSAKGPQLHVPARQTGPTRPKLVGPPTGPGSSAKGPQLHVPARQAGPAQAKPARLPEGAKRPLAAVGATHGAGFKAEPQAPTPQLQEQQRTAQPKIVTMKVVLKPVVAEKLKQLNSRGVKLTPEALRGLAAADAKDAEVLMQALLSRGEVPNPSNFITASLANLAKRQATEAAPVEQGHSVQHQPAAARAAPSAGASAARKVLPRGGPKGPKGPKGPGPVGSVGPVGPPAGGPGRAAPVAKVPGQGQPPKRRTADLSFERLAVQAKLFALNKQGIWAKQGKALDESALSALMQIEPARGLEILDEVEARGVGLVDPSRYARDLAAEEEKVYPPS